jgi:hypothetical protein
MVGSRDGRREDIEDRAIILQLPSPEEFARSSINLLNLAWNIALAIIRQADEVAARPWEDDELSNRYREDVQADLANAYTLIEQSQEFA